MNRLLYPIKPNGGVALWWLLLLVVILFVFLTPVSVAIVALSGWRWNIYIVQSIVVCLGIIAVSGNVARRDA